MTRIDALRPRLTADFLDTIHEAIEVCGWSVDMVETIDLYHWLCEKAGVQPKPVDASTDDA